NHWSTNSTVIVIKDHISIITNNANFSVAFEKMPAQNVAK
ncbi:hypothetical protein LTSEWAN_6515, partial [Salmonella enterica subsp. enterica serovar Wandsworth str. A4-580]